MKKFNAIIKEPNELEFTGAVYLFANDISEALEGLNAHGIQTDLITEISEDPDYIDEVMGVPSDAEVMKGVYNVNKAYQKGIGITKPEENNKYEDIKYFTSYSGSKDAYIFDKINEVIERVNKLKESINI